MTEARHVHDIRGIPIWLLRGYVEDAGGVPGAEDENALVGDGWTARLTQRDDYRIGSLAVGEVRLEIDGDTAAVDRLVRQLEPRLLRAGG